jgi:hypothetical protein
VEVESAPLSDSAQLVDSTRGHNGEIGRKGYSWYNVVQNKRMEFIVTVHWSPGEPKQYPAVEAANARAAIKLVREDGV